MPMPLPEKIEVKLAIVPEDTAKALAKLGLTDAPQEEKRIHFFDTEELVFFDRGLILRVRQTVTGGDVDDVTLKIRGPGAPAAAERFLTIATGAAKFEGDQNAGREELPSFSITTQPDPAMIEAIIAGTRALGTVLDGAGETLLRELGGAEATRIVCLGPIRSRSWKLKPKGFSGKITAELWDVAGEQLFELSDKTPHDDAPGLAAQLAELFADSDVRQLDTSKTRFALERIRLGSAN